MNEQELSQLEKQVSDLAAWKNARKSERLVNPVDYLSRRALTYWTTRFFNGLPIATGRVFSFGDSLISDLLAAGIEVTINGQKRIMLITFVLLPFTANATTDVITNTNGNYNLKLGSSIAMNSTGTLPGGLDTITIYYVINPSGTTFQVSLTIGGSPVDITDSGSGTHYYALL